MSEPSPLQKRPSLAGIDLVKLLCSVLVVSIHTNPFKGVSDLGNFVLVQGVARIAVPFFFLCSGYFFSLSLTKAPKKSDALKKFVVRISVVYLVWSLIFLPLDLAGRWTTDPRTTLVNIGNYFVGALFDGTHYHFWYFPALVSSIVLFYFLRNRVPWGGILALGALLYGFSCLGDSYFKLSQTPLLASIVAHWEAAFGTTRNLVLGSFLFVALGAWLAEGRVSIDGKVALALFLVFLGGSVLEALATEAWHLSKDHNTGVLLVPAALFLFLAARQWTLTSSPNSQTWRDWSLVIYCSHPLLGGLWGYTGIVGASGGVLGMLAKVFGLPVLYPLQFLIVTAFAFSAAFLIVNRRWKPFQWFY